MIQQQNHRFASVQYCSHCNRFRIGLVTYQPVWNR
ncbi:unnamed protein product [Lactuca saligna]|uniref:Uncharacterized protein n=1 Tax=Lactuca saligna TaxID=75948 RepID=A0AA35Z1B2_LACSI|nr:unnamed protein product [Lactuca saligna]